MEKLNKLWAQLLGSALVFVVGTSLACTAQTPEKKEEAEKVLLVTIHAKDMLSTCAYSIVKNDGALREDNLSTHYVPVVRRDNEIVSVDFGWQNAEVIASDANNESWTTYKVQYRASAERPRFSCILFNKDKAGDHRYLPGDGLREGEVFEALVDGHPVSYAVTPGDRQSKTWQIL